MRYTIIAINSDGTIIEYQQLMDRAFGDDLELAAEWIENVNAADRCPLEFTIAVKEEE